MQLNELIQSTQRERFVNSHDEEALKNDREAGIKNYTFLKGRGSSGKVVPNKKSPFTVKKSNYFPTYNIERADPYLYYIKAVVKYKMAESNPFFPRVYDILYLTDKRREQRYRIELEKLEHYDDFTDDELTSLTKRLFSSKDILTFSSWDDGTPIKILIELIENYNPIDKKLTEALSFIDNLKLETNFQYDWHENNIMFRRTGFGPQLVITDPLMN